MAILAYYGIKFVVAHPRKSCNNCQFIDIKEVVIGERHFDFEGFIEHYIVANNKALRRDTPHFNKYQKRNQTAATNNVLTEMLKTLGWKVSFKNSKEAQITMKMERINVLSCGGVVISGEEIARIGEKLNKGLKSVVAQKREEPLLVGAAELSIASLVDMSAVTRDANMKAVTRMLQPVNVSGQIGCDAVEMKMECDDACNNVKTFTFNNNINTNIINKNNNNSYGLYEYGVNQSEGEGKGVKTEQCGVEYFKAMEGQASQVVSQCVTGTVFDQSVSENVLARPFMAAALENAQAAAASHIIDHMNDHIRDIDHMRDMREMKEEKQEEEKREYDDELPPATNVPMTTPQCAMSSFGSSGFGTTQENVQGQWIYVIIDGQCYLCNGLPWTTPVVNYQDSVYCDYQTCQNTMNNNAVVEGVHEEEHVNEDCGFIQMANYFSTV